MSDKENKLNIERGAIFTENPQTGDVEAVSCEGARKLGTTDWEYNLTPNNISGDIFEVRFKNTRKGYYQNDNNLQLKIGDIVAVESNPGHDIGIISLTGDMVRKQMRCKGFDPTGTEFRKIYRIAKGNDIVKWQEAIALEHTTMIKARRYAQSLGLNMKIGDVEYQGDKIKAIFYYIADARVDFRELIRVFAEEFKVRIEMKQIGARQEAGRIGGIGSCGRELCCSTWVTNFVSVTTNSARFQEISLNPQKLAGQCGKLKCCLNYEVDSYIDSRKGFPKLNAPLEALDASYHLVKPDVLKREMIFSSDPHSMVNLVSISVERVKEIMHLNKKGIKVDSLKENKNEVVAEVKPDYMNVVGDDSITRFDKGEESGKPRRNRNKNRNKQSQSPDANNEKKEQKRENRGNNNASSASENETKQENNRPKEKRDNNKQRPQREQKEPVNNNSEENAKDSTEVTETIKEGNSGNGKNRRHQRRWNNRKGGGNGNNGGNQGGNNGSNAQ